METILAGLLALVLASGAPQAIGSLSVEVLPTDYPIEALRLQQEGETTVELLIDRKGRVKECAVLVSSGSLYLDAGTCKVMMDRAQFTYAGAARRKPRTLITQRLAWKLPR